MLRLLPFLVAGAVLAASGLVQGLWTDRWGASEEIETAAARLRTVARSVGDWNGEDLEINPRELALSGSTSCLVRRYVNGKTREALTVMILCGRPGPVSIHTPDVCYRGLGYEPIGSPIPWTAPVGGTPGAQPASFWAVKLRKDTAARVSHLRVLWSWSATGEWKAHDNPRIALAGHAVLFKIYLIREMIYEDESLQDDPVAEFLHGFLPELQRALFAG